MLSASDSRILSGLENSSAPDEEEKVEEEFKGISLSNGDNDSPTRSPFATIGNTILMSQPAASATRFNNTMKAGQANTPADIQVFCLTMAMDGLQLSSENTPPPSTSSAQVPQASSEEDVLMD